MERDINKVLLNECSSKERDEFFTHLEDDSVREQEFNEAFRLYAFCKILFNRSSNARKADMFRRFWSRAISRKGTIRKLVITGQAAAILFFMFYTVFSLYSNYNQTESFTLTSEKGSISSTKLDEGTKFWLNTSSSAKVIKSSEKEVIVSLLGEGYFEVEHNPDRTFIVEAGNYVIRDIGTSFIIKAYPYENKLIISVFDGIAHLETPDQKLLKSIQGGKEVEVDLTTGALTLKDSDYLADVDWKEGKFAFEESPLPEIIKEFEEWYDVEFIIKNEDVKSQLFTGSLKRKTSIEHLVHILKLSSDFDYDIEIKNDGSSLINIY